MSTTLTESLVDPSRRDLAVDTLVGVIDAEVAGKKGIGGTVIKTAYSAVKKVNDGIVRRAVNGMLPDMAHSLQPLWDGRGTTSFGAHLAAHDDQAADALLAVADARAANPRHAAVARIYNGVRPKAKQHVVAALPRLGTAVETLVS
ncbi:DUF6918 family protein [Arsenicicoccus sp. oral taxon 190]|uniref:DUF6918 family protein n=1 Tax=Arsenicicoccus sp. oral taxon 190 TaxID=1658671 RepID=UPI000679F06D|nr:hypothetical protein [Arsenicicoccus sp. oral taxon 190]AKT51033.1 hypothetical protein ADJ73_06380 [Arsenicicoccus sp. oral taxon 190]